MDQEKILKDHFEWDKMFDERYHCNHCSYDTQLPNKALAHFVKKHLDDVQEEPEKEPKTRSKRPVKDQESEPEPEPQDDKNNLVEEQKK